MPTFSIDILDVLIILGVGQGLLLLLLIGSRFQQKKLAPYYLAALLFVLSWLQLEFLAIRGVVNIPFPWFYGTRLGAWLSVGPLLFLYQRALIYPNEPFDWRRIRHFIPFVLFFIIFPLGFAWKLHPHAVSYGILIYLTYPQLEYDIWYYIYLILFPLQFIHLLYYLWASRRQLKEFTQTQESQYTERERNTVLWLSRLMLGFYILTLFALAFLVLSPWLGFYIRELDFLYVIPMVILTYLISYRSFRHLSLFQHIETPKPTPIGKKNGKKYEKSALTPEKALQLKERVKEHMQSEKPFLNNELTLRGLAQELAIPPYQLSQLLNEHFKKNFFDFINGYRVEEVIVFMAREQDRKVSLLEAAFACGFNNKTSFIRYFKKLTGQTPSQYFKAGKQHI
ncbi:MAG: helix-turn-helix domain-containing protein [Saprospiraceae bacterium]|nr:helix-turn-helix domain-containing protein [Saprospiraceae bacterium]